MITNSRQQQIYTAIFSAMIANHALSLPLHIGSFCDHLGIELCPLSKIVAETGMSAQNIFDIWGNKDGAVIYFDGRSKIAYNDYQPRGRMRFTLCEEISHVVLRHVEDSRFSVFKQTYSRRTYQEYDEEARIGAGLMLCQPQYFFKNRDMLIPSTMAYLCDITSECAKVRCEILSRFEDSITSNPLFCCLPQPQIRKKLAPCALEWDSEIGFCS